MAKQFKIPEPIKLKDPVTKNLLPQPAITFQELVLNALLSGPQFDNSAGWRAAVKIETALEKAANKDDKTVVLDEAVYKTLKEAAEKPSYFIYGPTGQKEAVEGFPGIGSAIARQLLPFLDCILNAEDI